MREGQQMNAMVKQMFLTYISILLAFMVLITVVSTINLSMITEKNLKEERLENVIQAGNQIDSALKKIDKDIIAFCDQNEVYRYITDSYADEYEKKLEIVKLQNMFLTFIRYNEMIDSIYLYSDTSGWVLTNKTYEPFSTFSDQSWFETPGYEETGEWRFSHTLDDVNPVQYFISLVRNIPVFAGQNRKGMIVVNINENKLVEILKSYTPGKDGGSFFVLDRENRILASDDKARLTQRLDTEISQVPQAGQDGLKKVRYQKQPFLMFYAYSHYTEWQAVSLEPRRDVYMARNVNLLVMLSIMLTMILLALVMLLRFGRRTRSHVSQYLNELESKIRSNVGTIKLRFVLELLTGVPLDSGEVREHMSLLNIDWHFDSYVVLLIRFEDKKSISSEIMENVDGLIALSEEGLAAVIGSDLTACILCLSGNDSAEVRERYLCTAEYLKAMLLYEFDRSFVIGLGNPCYAVEDIHKSYNQAVTALKYSVVMEENSIILFDSVQQPENDAVYDIGDSIGKINMLLGKRSISSAKQEIAELYQNIRENRLSVDYIRQFTIQIALELVKLLRASNVPEAELAAVLPRLDIYAAMTELTSIDEFERLLLRLAELLAENSKEKPDHKIFNEIIESIVLYVDENYTDPELSLNSLADKFGLSVSYLSRLFRSYTGRTFIEYMIEKRIQRAKELLGSTRMKVNEIGENVGYVNYISFVRIFKKYTGVNPSEYRRQP